MDKIYGAKFCE
uniref:Uncharacterized protein n=1 Tax=Lepeophtheirus salmonis TaxID=72036 RepID=A0A0K2V8R9_LEPSM